MSYPGRTFHAKPAPSKASLRLEARMVVMQRMTADKPLDAAAAAGIARSHGMSVAEVHALWDAEAERRGL